MPTRFSPLVLMILLGVAGCLAPARSVPQPARAAHGMVASASGLASRVGVGVLKRGGNAVDAAAAVGLALAVVYPQAGNLGGGGFLLIRLADGRADAIDYREAAPARATRTMYLDGAGNVIKNASLVGYRAVGVPGTVAGLALAQRRYGRLPWRAVVEPARRLAARGFVVSPALAASLQRAAPTPLGRFAASRRVFLRDGRRYRAGEVFRQPELAATLRRLERYGPREFYAGRTARLIARDMRAHGGLITRADLRRYRAVERAPLRGTYRGYGVLTMPPPSSGGVALLEMLNILERYDLRRLGDRTVRTDHLQVEAMRRAFADRAAFGGDPDFVRVPVRGLTSKAYAARLVGTIDPDRATSSRQIGAG
ncbi:MAG: gamma-glutamyltransferase, partial [Armatimonadetes bacterium]|nr:gamma-glutamyltransferase [Armatimonadota bacterium]